MFATFALVVVGWTLFRAPNIATAGAWFAKMFSFSDWTVSGLGLGAAKRAVPLVAALVLIEWFNRGRSIPAVPRNMALRWLCYFATACLIIVWRSEPQAFIYFQF